MTSEDLRRVSVNSASGDGEQVAETSGGGRKQMAAESGWD
jgi:hypothetical protein